MADIEKKKYQESDRVKQANTAYQTQLAAKPADYTSKYQAQIDNTVNQLQERKPFEYDVDSDALYKQLTDQYITGGKMAMMDTMGQAAAMTGGYGNSYAQMAGQGAYQDYLTGLNDMVPELYQMALDRYLMEGDQLMDQYNLLMGQDNEAYGRYMDSVNQWNNDTDRLYGQLVDERNFDYGMYGDDVAYDQWLNEFTEDERRWQMQWDEEHPTETPSSSGKEEKKSSGGGGGGYSLEEYLQYKQAGAKASDLDQYLTEGIKAGAFTKKEATEIRNTRY